MNSDEFKAVCMLQNDLKQAREAIKHLQATITALEEENGLYSLNEAILLARLKKQSNICTAGNNATLP